MQNLAWPQHTETDKEMNRRELLNQPRTVIISLQSKINAAYKEYSDWMGRNQ